MLHYFPLESYPERYTMQLSAAKTGWLEKKWLEYGVQYVRIDPDFKKILELSPVQNGVALDPVRRSQYCMEQVYLFLDEMKKGMVKDRDVIYLDDFWTPGIEAIFYTAHLMKIRLRIFANCWAQSVDEFDFTYQMRHWMRDFERGLGHYYEGIFVANTELKDKLIGYGIGRRSTVHVVGHPFDSEEVMSRMPPKYQDFIKTKNWPHYMREDAIVWSSRWDKEKDPAFFLNVMEKVLEHVPEAKFYVLTSAPKLRSNDPALLEMLQDALHRFPDNLFLREGLTKEEYYGILTHSKVIFNSADQDWISYGLLEASVAGCFPCYPYFRSFPETLQYQHEMMYKKGDVRDATGNILGILRGYGEYGDSHGSMDDKSPWSHSNILERSWIHKRYDITWLRMLQIMGLDSEPRKRLSEQNKLPAYTFPVYPL